MAGGSKWSTRYESWKAMSRRSYILFLAGVFFTFLPAGLLTDIPRLGANDLTRLTVNALFSGGVAVAYVVVVRLWPRLLVVLIALQIIFTLEFDRLFGPLGPPLDGAALRARLTADVNGATLAIIAGFVLLSQVLRAESTRHGRLRAEIALAKDRFTVAGHLPILHYQSATGTISELSTPEVPLAMFSDRLFTSGAFAANPATCS